MDGIILIDKPKGITSRDVVNQVVRTYHTRKVGHTGTLDPLATGVMVICIGRATKLVDTLTCTSKEYIAEVILGLDTDTLDTTGLILKEEEVFYREEQIDAVLESMTTTYLQEVPKYSAVKVNGRKLYEYARNNEPVTLPTKQVTIFSCERIGEVRYQDGKTIFQMKTLVSKGTYIRSLIRDLALKLNTVGVMSNLRRTKQGSFFIEDCMSLDQLGETTPCLSLKEVLPYPSIIVEGILEKKVQNGCEVDRVGTEEVVVFMNQKEEVLAIYEVSPQNQDHLKPKVMILEQKN